MIEVRKETKKGIANSTSSGKEAHSSAGERTTNPTVAIGEAALKHWGVAKKKWPKTAGQPGQTKTRRGTNDGYQKKEPMFFAT